MPEEHLGSFSQPQIALPEAPELPLGNMGRTAQDVLLDAQAGHEIFKDPFVIKAFQEAERAHHAQVGPRIWNCLHVTVFCFHIWLSLHFFLQYRVTGDLYLVHCVETAMILAAIGANKEVVAAGLLHDIVDDSAADYTELQEMFGKQVADLVEGVCHSDLSLNSRFSMAFRMLIMWVYLHRYLK